MKRKVVATVLAMTLATSMLAACGSSKTEQAAPDAAAEEDTEATGEAEAADGSDVGVALIVNGTIGDKSFNDLANAGLKRAEEELGVNGYLIENNYDTTKYEPSMREAAEDPDIDILIVNSADVKEIVQKVAPEYPDKKFVIYDSDIDFTAGDLSNVYAVTFKQNEASFLAGALGSKLTASEADRANEDKVIGFIAGGENVIINDFLLGYIEGCEYADPETKMLISYIGNFSDTAKGKEMALAQVNQKADVIFQVAAGAGLGVLEAAKESNIYAIGVDDDQYALFKESDEEQANAIVTSVMKSVDNCVYSIIERYMEGTLPYGETEALGIADGMVSIARNENYDLIVPDDIKAFIEETEAKISSGEIVVDTNIGADASVIDGAKERVKP